LTKPRLDLSIPASSFSLMIGPKISRCRSASGVICALLLALGFISFGCNRSRPTGRLPEPPEIAYGTPIVFGQGGNSEPYKASGWSKTEEKFTWSEGTSAQLSMRVPATENAVSLKMKMAALIKPPDLPFQPIEIQVNDQKIAEWQVGDTAEFVASLPHDLTKAGGVLTIVIKTPKATSPKALGLGADPRILGICCLKG
jgi:hypothetical protein